MEKSPFSNRPETPPEKPLLEKAYEQAVERLTDEEIRMEDFTDLYGEANVAADKQEVARLEKIFAANSNEQVERAKRTATILEAIFHEQFELSEWLGPNARTIRPTKYDDIKNGVDSLVEIEEDGDDRPTHLALAIDVTFSNHMAEKFERIKREIDQEKLAQVKYFVSQSESFPFRGELSQVPRVVIGASAETIDELALLWTKANARDKKAKEKLANHPIQFELLEQIIDQLAYFRNYATKQGKTAVIPALNRTERIVQSILEERAGLIIDSGQRDKMSTLLHDQMMMVM